MKTTAYRPVPEWNERLGTKMLWRPWMSRLGTVLLLVASPSATTYGITRLCLAYPNPAPGWAIALTLLLCFHLIGSIVLIGTMLLTDGFTQSRALKAAYAAIVFPCIGVARVAKWVAHGE